MTSTFVEVIFNYKIYYCIIFPFYDEVSIAISITKCLSEILAMITGVSFKFHNDRIIEIGLFFVSFYKRKELFFIFVI